MDASGEVLSVVVSVVTSLIFAVELFMLDTLTDVCSMASLVIAELAIFDPRDNRSLSVGKNVDVSVEVLSVTVVDSSDMGPLVIGELPALDPIDDIDLLSQVDISVDISTEDLSVTVVAFVMWLAVADELSVLNPKDDVDPSV